jgi:hypothetical protein
MLREVIAALAAVVAAIVAVLIALAVAIRGAIAAAVMASAGEAAVSPDRLSSKDAFFTVVWFSVCRVASRSWPGVDLSRLPVVRGGATAVRLVVSSEARLTAFRPTPGRELAAAPSAFPAATAVARGLVNAFLAKASRTLVALAFLSATGTVAFPPEFRVLLPFEEPATVLPEALAVAAFLLAGMASARRFSVVIALPTRAFFDDGAPDWTSLDLLALLFAVSVRRFGGVTDPAAFRPPDLTVADAPLFFGTAFALPVVPPFAS